MPSRVPREVQYMLVQHCAGNEAPRSIGILLFDPQSKRLFWRIQDHWQGVADLADVAVLSLLSEHLQQLAIDMGAEKLLSYLEDTLSNGLLVSERKTARVVDVEATLAALFEEHVVSAVQANTAARREP